MPIRLFRVSFTGEAGYEVNLPPEQAQRLWDTLRERGVTPYGTDAMHVLRAEKGYIIVGQETDGTVTPDDVGLGWTIGGGDFVGKRSLSLADLKRPDRKQLVGLLAVDRTVILEEGSAICPSGSEDRAERSGMGAAIGHVTSSYPGGTLGRPFALGLVRGGRSRIGTILHVPTLRGRVEVTVADPVFVDKAGENLRGLPVPRVAVEPMLPGRAVAGPVAIPCGRVQLTALGPAVRLSIRAGSAAGTAIGVALGVLLPTAPCRSVVAGDRAALWLGPDEWLVLAPETATGLAAQAVKAAGDHGASVVDVSHGSRLLEISGERAERCLNAFCALDLDAHVFPVGMCTRTLLGKVEVVLWRIAPEVFRLDVSRSFAPYVWGCLEEARREFADAGVVFSR